jgi:integrase
MEEIEIPEEWRLGPSIRANVKHSQSLAKLIVRLYRRGSSVQSAETYAARVIRFCQWLKLHPDEALRSRLDWAGVVNEYLDYLRVSIGTSPSYANVTLAAIKKWLKVNNVDVEWNNIESVHGWQVERDRVPTKEDLRKILGVADLSTKVLAEVAISSGLRLSTIISLKLKDLRMEYDTPAIIVKPEIAKDRPRRGFVTFLSPEAKTMVQAYLKERERRGEKLSPESYLISAERPAGSKTSLISAEKRWLQALIRSGLQQKGRKWSIYHAHTLRKYFSTWTKLSGVDSWVVEFFMGHRSGINQVYFLAGAEDMENAQVLERLMNEYKKALPALEIFNEAEKVKELAQTIEQQKKQFEEERKKFEEEKKSWERRFAELEAELDSLIDIIARSRNTASKDRGSLTSNA